MTKTETRVLTREQLRRKVSGQKKVPGQRHDQGLFLIGYIQCLRDIAKLFRTGNKDAQFFAAYAEHREQLVVKQLRKL